MDLWIIATVSTFLLMNAESDETTTGLGLRETSLPTHTTSNSKDCFCKNTTSAAPAAPSTSSPCSAPALGLLTVEWMSKCEGHIKLIHSNGFNSSLSVCHHSSGSVQNILRNVCENQKSCEGKPIWRKGTQLLNGYNFPESVTKQTTCEALRIQCREVTDLRGQLRAYKVVAALLCCLLLLLLLICFTRPTVKALQKRLSNRRQNRWVGPTQSHSVSYHRGMTAVKNTEEDKRLSYPALERLTVSCSREPSSNRNSDYNF